MRTVRRSASAAALAVLATLAAAAPASAVNRYVSGTGTATTDCLQANPCSLTAAVAVAGAGDVILVGPGYGYAITSQLQVPDGVTLTGIYGEDRPLISGPGVKLGPGATIQYMGVHTTGAGVDTLILEGATARDLVVLAEGGAESGVDLRTHPNGTLLQDATVYSEVPGADTIQIKDSHTPGDATVLSTTVVASMGAKGIHAKADLGTQSLINTVVWSAEDIRVKGLATLDAKHSNFRPAAPAGVVDSGGNQTAKPCWIAEDDPRPLSSSPTVDAGLADLRLVSDGWGIARAPADIGSLEYSPAYDVYGTDCLYPAVAPVDPGPDPEPPPPTDDSSTGGDPAGGGSTTTPPPPPPPPPAPEPKPEPKPEPTTDTGPNSTPTTTDPTTTTTDEPSQLPPAAPPVLGTSVTIGESKGQVTVRLPGTNTAISLTADATIPVGAVIDATNGTVQLTSAADAKGKTQTGTFWGGEFKVKQTKDRYTELILAGDALDSCKPKKGTKGKKKARNTRSLWGRDRGGRFRTRGRNGTATVRGTRWYTEDRCDGTLFRVTQGAIDVRDNVDRRTVRLKAGDRYFADNTPAKRKKKSRKR